MIVKKIYIKSLERSEISKKLFDYERGQFEFALLDENRVSVSCFEEFDRLTKNSKQFTDRERKRQLFRKFFPKGYYDLLSLLVEGDDDAIEFGRFAGCVSFVNGFIEGKEREKNPEETTSPWVITHLRIDSPAEGGECLNILYLLSFLFAFRNSERFLLILDLRGSDYATKARMKHLLSMIAKQRSKVERQILFVYGDSTQKNAKVEIFHSSDSILGDSSTSQNQAAQSTFKILPITLLHEEENQNRKNVHNYGALRSTVEVSDAASKYIFAFDGGEKGGEYGRFLLNSFETAVNNFFSNPKAIIDILIRHKPTALCCFFFLNLCRIAKIDKKDKDEPSSEADDYFAFLFNYAVEIANGLFELLDNALKHVCTGDKRSFCLFSAYFVETDGANGTLHIELLDYNARRGDDAAYGILEQFNKNTNLNIKNLESLFKYDSRSPEEDQGQLRSFFEKIENRVLHYGLQIFDKTLEAHSGVMRVLTGRKESPSLYQGDSFFNLNDFHLPGTEYRISIPLVSSGKIAKQSLENPYLNVSSGIIEAEKELALPHRFVPIKISMSDIAFKHDLASVADMLQLKVDHAESIRQTRQEVQAIVLDFSSFGPLSMHGQAIQYLLRSCFLLACEKKSVRIIGVVNLQSPDMLQGLHYVMESFYDRAYTNLFMADRVVFFHSLDGDGKNYSVRYSGEKLGSVFYNLKKDSIKLGSIYWKAFERLKAYSQDIVSPSRHDEPFPLLSSWIVLNEEENLTYTQRVLKEILERDVYGESMGCKNDVHINISNYHLDGFYEAVILFGNAYWSDVFASYLFDLFLIRVGEYAIDFVKKQGRNVSLSDFEKRVFATMLLKKMGQSIFVTNDVFASYLSECVIELGKPSYFHLSKSAIRKKVEGSYGKPNYRFFFSHYLQIDLVGYEAYSALTLEKLKYLIQNAFSTRDVKVDVACYKSKKKKIVGSVLNTGALGKTSSSYRLAFLVVGISSTLLTFARLENAYKALLSKQEKDIDISSDCIKASVIQIQPIGEGEKPVEITNGFAGPNHSMYGFATIKNKTEPFPFFVSVGATFYKPDRCPICKGEYRKWKMVRPPKPLIEVEETSLVPLYTYFNRKDIRGKPFIEEVTFPLEEEARRNANEILSGSNIDGFDCLFNDHIVRDGTHYQYLFDVPSIFAHFRESIIKWAEEVSKRYFDDYGEEDKRIAIIVTPSHFTSSAFPFVISEVIFHNRAEIIDFDYS